jgi:hypothetical protein
MQTANWQEIEEAKKAALEVLLHNAHGPFHGLPRTAVQDAQEEREDYR